MSRSSVLLAALTDEPTSTSDLYDKVGYANLLREGLIQYNAFHAALDALAVEGLAERMAGPERAGEVAEMTAPDNATLWRLPSSRR